MERFWQDVKFALRSLCRAPGFAATLVVILGAGIGMSVAMVTIFDAVLLQELPVLEQDHIVALRLVRESSGALDLGYKDIEQLRRESRTLRGVAGVWSIGAVTGVSVDGDSTVEGKSTRVTTNFFDVLGARPALGRFFVPEDGVGDMGPSLVISYKVWQRDFGGSVAVLGHRLRDPFNQSTRTVIGVAPPGLDYPSGVEFWATFADAAAPQGMTVIARLTPDATVAAARAESFAILQRFKPEVHSDRTDVRTFTEEVLGNVRPMLVALAAAVGVLLLIACVNVGNLLLLRAGTRVREVTIRRAIGASYGDIVQQFLVESGALALAGGALGFVCAEVLLHALLALAPAQLPRTDAVAVAGAPFAIACCVTVLTVLMFGVAPALIAARVDLASPLRLDSRSGMETRVRRRARQMLVALQMSLALLSLAAAGLLVRSLDRLQRLNLGYAPDHLAVLAVAYPQPRYTTVSQRIALGEALYPPLRAVPGVTSLTPVRVPPYLGADAFSWKFAVEGQSNDEAAFNPPVALDLGDEEYFRTFGIPLLQGRGFTDYDRADAALVVVVTESVARRYWPGQSPVGKRLRNFQTAPYAWRTVVGVVGDAHLRTLRESTPTLYMPWRQAYWPVYIAVRTEGDLTRILPAMRRAMHDVDPDLKLYDARTMADYIAGPIAVPRMAALLLSGFGLVAMLLAAVGLYGVMASLVRSQSREIGIRVALGARPGMLSAHFLRQGLAISALGAGVGMLGAFATMRFLGSLLFQVSVLDPVTLCGVMALLLLVAAFAAYLPARRAAYIDPVRTLRGD